ncbi:hypothetical protein Btru_040002 [Bulinus truncatus]|nr:hypothetical protein Btru_040002 [Bulinus truncatus]
MEKPWERAKRFERYDFWRKSSYPPMQIEPVRYERNRLAGEGMTPEQRALRKQWVTDQVLHHEPRVVPEIQPLNFFRRIYRYPADKLIYGPAKKLFGHDTALLMRLAIPKLIMAYAASYLVWYHLKYNQRDWTREGGVIVFGGKPTLFGKDALNATDKDKTDYCDRGYKSRKALLFQQSTAGESNEPCF